MKFVIITILAIVLGLIAYGFYIKGNVDYKDGQIIIGIAVMTIAFVLMPLFIFHRYKNKDLSNFKFNNNGLQQKEEEEKEEKQDQV